MKEKYEKFGENSNPDREKLRKVLSSRQGLKNIKNFFDRNRKSTSQGEYYDFNGDSCRGIIHQAAATLIFIAYPSNGSTMHLFPEKCEEYRQELLYNTFYRVCLPTDYITFPETEDVDDPVVVVNGEDFTEAKRERVEKLGVSDLVSVLDSVTE